MENAVQCGRPATATATAAKQGSAAPLPQVTTIVWPVCSAPIVG